MTRGWSGGETVRDGLVSLEAIRVGAVQEIHLSGTFVATKPKLVFVPADLLADLEASDPERARILAAFFRDPEHHPELRRGVARPYFEPLLR